MQIRRKEGLLRRLERKIAGRVHVKPATYASERPVVSFTFDDIPRSAAQVGARLLSQRDLAGTFYVCGGLTDGVEEGLPCHTRDDLARLVADGHELAAHTNRHVPAPSLSAQAFRSEADAVDVFLEEIAPGTKAKHFSYPFGLADFGSKRRAAERYATARGIAPGINVGRVDAAQLRAVALYSESVGRDQARAWIERAVTQGGWLIFYTHDVSASPSRFGSTPELLQIAIDYAVQAGASVETVDRAARRLAPL